MKKTILSVGLGLMALAVLPSCGGDKAESGKAAASKNSTPVAAKKADSGNLPNFRFIDSDTIGLKYNLAVDFT